MENIKKIYINEDGTPHTTHYNGSWNVILTDTTDDIDYSMMIWQSLDECYDDSISDEEYIDRVKSYMIMFSEAYNIELEVVPETIRKESKANYYVQDLVQTKLVIDSLFEGKPKPTLLESIENLTSNEYRNHSKEEMMELYNNDRKIFEESFEYSYTQYKKLADECLSEPDNSVDYGNII
jgi:hypothetical protein